MKIYVTKNDIAHGIPRNSGQCPIARSMRRRFPRRFITVGPCVAMVGFRMAVLPTVARSFIFRFDLRPTRQKPIVFTLDLQ